MGECKSSQKLTLTLFDVFVLKRYETEMSLHLFAANVNLHVQLVVAAQHTT